MEGDAPQAVPSPMSRLGVATYILFIPVGLALSFLPLIWVICTGTVKSVAIVLTLYLLYISYINSRVGLNASKSGRWPTPLRWWSLWWHAARYFPTDLIKTADLDPKRNYIFVYAPHGVASVAVWVTFDSEATGFAHKFPGIRIHPLTLEMNFRLPLIREFLLLHGICDASRTACKRILAGPPGSSILLAVGGAQESLYSAPGTLDLVLHKRKGFVRVALESGASIVPVIGFGENELYDTYIPQAGSFAKRMQRLLLKFTGFTLPLFVGCGFFSGRGLMPKPVPLNVVVGKPLQVTKYCGEVGTPEHTRAVDEVHASYVAALKGLFDGYKDRFAKGRRRSLEIVE